MIVVSTYAFKLYGRGIIKAICLNMGKEILFLND